MFNTQVTEKTINEQAPDPASDIEGMPIQVLYLQDTLKDSRRYACAKIVDLQDTSGIPSNCIRKQIKNKDLQKRNKKIKLATWYFIEGKQDD